jgi:hypothetical protein
MTTPAITDLLKYAELQMAAEAFFRKDNDSPLTIDRTKIIEELAAGNNHACPRRSKSEPLGVRQKTWTG